MAYDIISSSFYIPEKNVLLIDTDMSEYLIEYYTQRKDQSLLITAEQDNKLKDLIACFSIHLAARTALENHAWTFNIVSEKPYSLFVAGSTGELDEKDIARGFLVGNILTENIRYSDTSGVHAQCVNRGKTFNSYVPCDTSNITEMVETFYLKSEQLPLRVKLSDNSDTGIGLAALPGYDPEWFAEIDLDDFKLKLSDNDKKPMRTCRFDFKCDCSAEKLLPFFKALSKKELDELYGKDSEILIICPRCGKRFTINREKIK